MNAIAIGIMMHSKPIRLRESAGGGVGVLTAVLCIGPARTQLACQCRSVLVTPISTSDQRNANRHIHEAGEYLPARTFVSAASCRR
jgi:hypothetical protein